MADCDCTISTKGCKCEKPDRLTDEQLERSQRELAGPLHRNNPMAHDFLRVVVELREFRDAEQLGTIRELAVARRTCDALEAQLDGLKQQLKGAMDREREAWGLAAERLIEIQRLKGGDSTGGKPIK